MFRWIFHKKELLTTFDSGQYNEVMRKLSAAGIPFRNKWKGPGNTGRQRGALGSLGENLHVSIQYYIYVLEEDLERAQFILR